MGLFGLLKSIPIVGPAVKVTAIASLVVSKAVVDVANTATLGLIDKLDEANRDFQISDGIKDLGLGMDIANLNPLKAANNMANGIVANTGGLKRGVWLGKRPLGRSPVSLTVGPATSLAHWAILFNGTLYHCTGKDSSGYCKIEITNDQDEINTFTWNILADEDDIRLSRDEIRKYAESFRTQKYSILSSLSDLKDNCQSFVFQMVLNCTNFSKAECLAMLLTLGGSTYLM